MKHSLGLLLFFIFSVGCASFSPPQTYVKTVSSDLYPTEMARDKYYEEMGRAYSFDQQNEKAIEYFRLALLHNPKRVSAKNWFGE